MTHPLFVSKNFDKRWPALTAIPALLLALSVTCGWADWPDNTTNRTKWVEGPDRSTSGFDVLAGPPPFNPNGTNLAIILADDFQCLQTGPITDIHLWTSWLGLDCNGIPPTNVPPIVITLGIWTDIPAFTNGGVVIPSRPGQRLWAETFQAGQYVLRPWSAARERFWDPDPAPKGVILGPDCLIWQYNFYPTNPFVQVSNSVYWLSMTASAPLGSSATSLPLFGWKTSTNQVLDNAVFGHLDAAGNPLLDWQELLDPTRPSTAAPRSLDLSFVLTTAETRTNPPPPPPPVKALQEPNVFGGYDVMATLPFVVADDFICTNGGTITNIQIWASWLNDQVDTNITFVLGIWTDVAATTTPFSHPGTIQWSETFTPGQYTGTFVQQGQERFLIPPGQTAPETQVWRYEFNPTQPFCQQGSFSNRVVYWLSVYAIPSASGTSQGVFGWKTSTNHFMDDAVFGMVPNNVTNAGNWQELFSPPGPVPQISLDMAFELKNGPPSPDCDRGRRVKWVQPPDASTNGLDVLATVPEILGDDFLCRSAGPISGITVWGSWLNDNVDTNATFILGLWTDVPAQPGTTNSYSHPGRLLCSNLFYPPQTPGTSLQRYQAGLYNANVQETFYNPDVPGTAGFIGRDTQIWRYDFYPFQPGCWHQDGSPFGNGQVYWISLSYVPAVGNVNTYLFGWKTSTTHNLDDAVYGHLNAANSPIGDWKDLINPITGQSLDLSYALYNFPVTGINKDLINHTGQAVLGVQLVVQGLHVITWHYDGLPPWPVFQSSYAGGNTVLQWTGQTLPPGGATHVGFEMASLTKPIILSINWIGPSGIIQPPIPQWNFHWLNSGLTLVLVNDIAQAPLMMSSGTVEYYTEPVPLDQMNPTGNRTPVKTAPLQFPTDVVYPGGALVIPLPPYFGTNYAPPPTNITYAMFQVGLSSPAAGPTTTDFVLLPLDSALQPTIESAGLLGSSLNLVWTSIPGRVYHVEYTTDLTAPNWIDTGLGDIPADNADTSALVPLPGAQAFYRVYLLPQ
ncbi:exported hypothetical protein [Verrucomicrobia bacterium]|nr:exported hypothetical protein [Verrucomicrobiota bacterium]